MAVSIFQRKLDLTYLVYFIVHLFVLFLFDLTPLYPSYRPAFSTQLLKYQGEVYQDRFFTEEFAYFEFFRWMEAAVHVPVSLWAVGALLRGDYKIPAVLLAYAIQTSVTTATCIYDYSFWTQIDATAKWHLTSLYGPYLLLSVVMVVDMFMRVKSESKELQALKAGKKSN